MIWIWSRCRWSARILPPNKSTGLSDGVSSNADDAGAWKLRPEPALHFHWASRVHVIFWVLKRKISTPMKETVHFDISPWKTFIHKFVFWSGNQNSNHTAHKWVACEVCVRVSTFPPAFFLDDLIVLSSCHHSMGLVWMGRAKGVRPTLTLLKH